MEKGGESDDEGNPSLRPKDPIAEGAEQEDEINHKQDRGARAYLNIIAVFMKIIITSSWMAPLAHLLLFSNYKLVGYKFFSLLFTSLAVLLSTVLYLSKHKVVPGDKLGKGNGLSLSSTSEKRRHGRESIAPTPMHKSETVTQAKENDDDDSEVLLSTFEDYEIDHTLECLDGTISDEDSLIEISLPSGCLLGRQKEESKYNNCSLQQKKRELSAETLFNKQSLMEFLAVLNEMNEEENFIEIDIALGSIKYPRLVQQCEASVPHKLWMLRKFMEKFISFFLPISIYGEDGNGEWSWQKIPNHIVNKIRAMVAPQPLNGTDIPAWALSSDGTFSTEAAYQSICI
ncbi:hypothetical protein CR513_12788, partial [Mucuna pruriens]